MSAKVDYFEIGTPNSEETKKFYEELFGWKIGELSDASYRMVNGYEGGVWDTSGMGGDTWGIFYVHVEDVEDTVRKAETLGAKVVVPITRTPDLDFAHLIDTQGTRFGVWRPKSDGQE